MKNKGFSLVELLVAMSIAAVVAGSVGFLLTTSLRMFGNETTDIELQQELQTSLNQVIDYAMETQTVVVNSSAGSTNYLALGTVDKTDSSKLNAEVFFVNNGKLYMCKKTISDYEVVQDTSPRNLDEKVSEIKTNTLSNPDALSQCLLAENVTSFNAEIKGITSDGTEHIYNNPLSMDISLQFKKRASSKDVEKNISDTVVFRNTLHTKIYVDGIAYSQKKSANNTLSITTETVELEKRTGDILIPGTKDVPKSSLTILEIIPDYSYDYVQYVIGGYNNKLNNIDNITYGGKAQESPIKSPIEPEELEGYFIRMCGNVYYNEHIDPATGFFPNNNGADLNSIVVTPDRERVGYYEYVGHEKGIYAIYYYDNDSNQIITRAEMCSKYSNSVSSSRSKDFGWIWHEAEEGSNLYDGINNGSYCTYVSTLSEGTKETGEEFSRGTRIYLKNHKRYGIVNNELFKLFVMQGAVEQYVDGSPKMLDILNGRWDTTNNKYSEVNDKALKKWEAAGNKIKLEVRLPKEITKTDIDNCDMIIIGRDGDGGFDWASSFSRGIKQVSYTPTTFSLTNDLSFDVVTEIYKRVCAEEISIACPYEIDNVSDSGKELNLSKMYKMIYCISNWTQSDEDLIKDVVRNAKNKKIEEQGTDNYWSIDPDYMKDIESKVVRKGSGRELFRDFLISYEGKELSKSLYDNHTLENKTTDFIYIDLNGDVIIPAQTQNGKTVKQKLGTTTKSYTLNTYSADNKQSFNIMYANSAEKSLQSFEYVFLLRNYVGNDFLLDRYRAEISRNGDKNEVYTKKDFVYNEEYGYKYKFYYDSGGPGMYRNTLSYMSTSNLFTFYKKGGSGMLQLGVANQNSHPTETVEDPDIIGTVEYVGADDIASGDARKTALSNSLSYKYEDNPTKYAFRLETLGNGTNKKVFYMSTEDYERAQTEGLYLYVLVKTSKDPTNYNKCVLHYERNPEDWDSWGRYGRFDYEAFNFDSVNNESSDNVIKYKAGTETNEAYVREYRYKADPEYFQHIYAPNNNGNNYIEARIDADGGREYRGSDVIYFIIRDEFDLD